MRPHAVHVDGSARTYRLSDGLPIHAVPTTGVAPTQVTFVGDVICAGGSSQESTLWSTAVRWELERTIGSINDPAIISDRVTALDFRRDGLSLAIGSGAPSRSGEVKVFAVETGQLVRDFGAVHSDTVLDLEFSPEGDIVASSAADKTIRLLAVATGSPLRSLEGHTHHVLSISWQDDRKTLASASADRNVKVWNTETGEQRQTIGGFAKEITAVSFVQTSGQIVTACADGNVRLSETSNGSAVHNMNAAGDLKRGIGFQPVKTKPQAGSLCHVCSRDAEALVPVLDF
jgi:WD40 repeat protein